MQAQALSLTVAWLRLERAHAEYARILRRDFNVSPLQIAILTIVSERPSIPLAALRKALVMHPATLGQSVDDLRRKSLCRVRTDPDDRRARLVAITETGRTLLETAPVAGPARLRDARIDPVRLEALKETLDEAITVFGLDEWAPKGGSGR